MKRELFNDIKKEIQYIGLLFLLAIIIFKVAFFNEEFIILIRSVLSLFWLFALPGYFIMLYWREKIGFLERFFIGTFLSAAIIGILSYYIALIGIDIKFHAVLIPIILILLGLVINLRKTD